jgi:hypothetical protein
MKNQVLSIEQMQHLKELGVDTSNAKMAWYATYETKLNRYNELRVKDEVYDKHYPSIPTFTLQDMLEMIADIPDFYKIKIAHEEDDGWCFGVFGEIKYINDYQTNLLDLAYQTLCWLAENNYIGGEK